MKFTFRGRTSIPRERDIPYVGAVLYHGLPTGQTRFLVAPGSLPKRARIVLGLSKNALIFRGLNGIFRMRGLGSKYQMIGIALNLIGRRKSFKQANSFNAPSFHSKCCEKEPDQFALAPRVGLLKNLREAGPGRSISDF